MRIDKNNYFTIGGIKFTVKEKNKNWNLDFTYNGKRIKRSSYIKATESNLIEIEKLILPQIVEELTQTTLDSNIRQDTTKNEVIIDDLAKDYFVLQKPKVRPHVLKTCIANFYRQIFPYFKGRTLISIRSMEVQIWLNKLDTEYKRTTVLKYRSLLNCLCNLAVQQELIPNNPVTKTTAPKEKQIFNNIEVNKFIPFNSMELELLTNIDALCLSNFIGLMVNSGIRNGEMIALQWKDIDFINKKISVNKTIVNGVVGDPKTISSNREVDMLEGSYVALKKQFKLTGHSDYVFLNSRNKPFFSADVINVNFRRRLIELNIKVRPIYSLRHTFASRMITSGVSISWVSKMLGHKNIGITLGVYTKYIIEDDEVRLSNLHKIEKLIGA